MQSFKMRDQPSCSSHPHRHGTDLLLNNSGVEALGILDIDSLDVGVESLLGALLVVTLARDADPHTERNALDTALPDLLVQLGIETDVGGALLEAISLAVLVYGRGRQLRPMGGRKLTIAC